MKVDFLIIGAQKGGSTWLFENIRMHPNVSTPPHEVHYFSSNENFARGVDWYHSHFQESPDISRYGEKTPEYLTVIPSKNPKLTTSTHCRIFEYNPAMKMIAVLREPISRLRSAVNHMYRTRRVPPWVSVHELVMGSRRENGELFGLLQQGQYYESLVQYLEVFPPDQLKIFFFETDIREQPMKTLESACRFLGLPYEDRFFTKAGVRRNEYQMSWPALVLNHVFPRVRMVNNRLNHIFPPHRARISPEVEDFLKNFYGPGNEKLKQLTGAIPKNWQY